MEQQEYKEIDILELLAPIRAHWLKIVFVALLGALTALLISIYLLTPIYQAEALVIVNNLREGTQTNVTNDEINSAKQLVNTYAVILKGHTEMLNEVIEELNLDMTSKALGSLLSAEPEGSTQAMRLSLRHEDPNQALAILQSIVNRAPDILIQTVKAGSVEIISHAMVSSKPVSPNITKNTILGFGAGLVVALAFVYIRKFLKNTFISDDDISRELGLPVLGVIPKIKIEG